MNWRGEFVARRLDGVLPGLGLLFTGVVLAEVLVQYTQPDPVAPVFFGGILTNLPFLVVLVGGGLWLSRADVAADRYPRIAGRTAGGLVFFGGFLGLVAWLTMDGLWVRIGTVRWGAIIGTGGGALIGLFEARAIEQAVARERAAVRAEEADRRRELLAYLNALLRHEVLNTANVIEGYATMLEEADSGPEATTTDREYAATIRRQADELAEVTKDVRLLLDAAEGSRTLEPTPVVDVVRTELESLRDRHERVETELAAPDEPIRVPADDLLRRLFSNLLDNAVEHNDGDVPRVTVSVDPAPEAVTVRIADDGPGIPAAERETLFDYEPGSGAADHGLGLSIVQTLADRYGGRVELTETGPEGTVFGVVLPRADAPAPGDSSTTDPESARSNAKSARPETP